MSRSRFTETQISLILEEAEADQKGEDFRREQGISNATYYQWKSSFADLDLRPTFCEAFRGLFPAVKLMG